MEGVMEVMYLKTEFMIADMLTKSVTADIHDKLIDALLGRVDLFVWLSQMYSTAATCQVLGIETSNLTELTEV